LSDDEAEIDQALAGNGVAVDFRSASVSAPSRQGADLRGRTHAMQRISICYSLQYEIEKKTRLFAGPASGFE
jgi:hypothetical protein